MGKRPHMVVTKIFMSESTEILIIGAGSAGFAAAYRALQGGCQVTLVDKNPLPGGTSVFGGVNCWEPGVSGSGVHFELARRLLTSGGGFVGKTALLCRSGRPYALSDRSDDSYESTLKRFGVSPEYQRRFHFEPDEMSSLMLTLLHEADTCGKLTALWNSTLSAVEAKDGRILSCTIRTPDGERSFRPKLVIDASADIVCAQMAGCATAVGEEACSLYGEEIAPPEPRTRLNGITQCFRIDKGEFRMPEEYKNADIGCTDEQLSRTVSCLNVYPRGGINVNMLPTIEGEALLRLPYDRLTEICRARVWRYFAMLRQREELQDYTITEIFPMPGIRESRRLVGRYVLRYEDLRRGISSLGEARSIAIADHPADMHGIGGGLTPMGVYKIPYDCLLAREADNLLVACRGASFSHIAASSARLSRTMLELGEAAGRAAAYCAKNSILPADVSTAAIQTFSAI